MTPEQFAEHLTRSPISERSLAIEWIRITARDDYLDDASARREILAILAGLDLVEHAFVEAQRRAAEIRQATSRQPATADSDPSRS